MYSVAVGVLTNTTLPFGRVAAGVCVVQSTLLDAFCE